MHGFIPALEVLFEVMNLRVAIVAGGDAIVGRRLLDLFIFETAIIATRLGETGLQKAAAPAAAVIVGAVWGHVNKVFLPDNGLDHKTQILGNGVSQGLSDQLAGILNRELDLQILVPVRADLEFALPYPSGIILNNAFDFKRVRDVEFVQSDPD
jgi:hypothetical protein